MPVSPGHSTYFPARETVLRKQDNFGILCGGEHGGRDDRIWALARRPASKPSASRVTYPRSGMRPIFDALRPDRCSGRTYCRSIERETGSFADAGVSMGPPFHSA